MNRCRHKYNSAASFDLHLLLNLLTCFVGAAHGVAMLEYSTQHAHVFVNKTRAIIEKPQSTRDRVDARSREVTFSTKNER